MQTNEEVQLWDMVEDMEVCMRSFQQVSHVRPTVLDAKTALLRAKLVTGEAAELVDALADGDLVEQFDACIDLIYVVLGTMVANGTSDYLAEGWKQVHENNMTKLVNGQPLLDASGKFIKPDTYRPVDLTWILNNPETLFDEEDDA